MTWKLQAKTQSSHSAS